MKILKKVISVLLLLASLTSLFACGEYQAATRPTRPGDADGDLPDGQPEMNDDPTDDFIVTLRTNGQPYLPRTDMYAIWSDGVSTHRAPVDEDTGIARIDGLDGDYRVTLSGLPNEYSYNPNAYTATNDNRSIVIDMQPLNNLSGSGDSEYECYQFRDIGVYSAVIENADDAIFFEFAPKQNGVYTIESWIDTEADQINPYIEVWYGSSQYKYFSYKKDDGGPVGSYTINFVHEFKIAQENISSAGQEVCTFAVKADSKSNKYPITVTFAVKRDGDFELSGYGYGTKTVAVPKLDFSTYNVAEHEYDDSLFKITGLEYAYESGGSTYVFDDSRVKLYKKSDGGDGFYHLYDKDVYSDNNGYGPILYARISSEIPILRARYNTSGYVFHSGRPLEGNSLTFESRLSTPTADYTHFIKGYTFLSTMGNIYGGSFYCVSDCPCHANSVGSSGFACAEGCTKCKAMCTQCPEELIGNEGYQSITNSDGMVAVTEELHDFLVDFCLSNTYFDDGEGSLEGEAIGGRTYQAVGDSAWLIACAYYQEK